MDENLSESVKTFLEKRQLESVKNFYDTPEWRKILDDKETLEEKFVRHYRNCGSHSNIPPCCVDFFIKYWRGRVPVSWIGRTYHFLKRCRYPLDRRPQYVVCPKCLIKGRAQPLHECDWQSASVRMGECKPTGRVIGFDDWDSPADGVKKGSVMGRLLRRFRKEYVTMVIEYESEDVDPVTGRITGRVIEIYNDPASADISPYKN